ncbi:triacylglycerol lipase OBL1 isoform X2 [Tripterygium wilfordii]|uniref:triacylglycerol lipase OBL1 isoform X2 n=1 Tax=Tripterygium wilfordii TaxID=458696 RepID=UPI0018F85456|nr:triacylglycerol lipase OBL1 isoform X2 [Tripterygium wilfordii]
MDSSDGYRYLVVSPEKGGLWDLWRFTVWGDLERGVRFLEGSEEVDEEVLYGLASDNRWVIAVSIVVRKIIAFSAKPMEYSGYVVDFILNLLSLNGNLLGLLYNIVHGKVAIPKRGTETFISTIGQIDGRIDLYRAKYLVEEVGDSAYEEREMKVEPGSRALMDLCIMASKLAYENAEVVGNVVIHHWKMHFVDFYNCWNDYQKGNCTQVFILCDKPKDASLILISFRGTEPFDADDWITDFDYSWYEIPKLGKVHMGFLEALGLGNRADAVSFKNHLLMKDAKFTRTEGAESVISETSSNSEQKQSAYYAVRSKLESLLKEHKNAKFVVTGHSLGGALAILFPVILLLHEEMEIMQKLLGVYTFGQPRVGDRQLGNFMRAHVMQPEARYFRVVYCNDLVPRLPYDDQTFLYKHFGACLYYNSCYIEQEVDEEPDPNFFGLRYMIPVHLNAAWELIRSLTMGYTHGPEYKEGWFSILVRFVGLVVPGIAAHCPTDYVNTMRLGKKRVVQMSSF